ncbi:glycosyltransferase family 2 protein [Nigerium massiliense]|uniref:glycosyltransferase family 2 protein n=1 Tax=Nigerium massiliense TaxID=1522317 RepID=UPI00058B33CD|nr:glycosyltransferase family 2 protein [Nigerium massiliense]
MPTADTSAAPAVSVVMPVLNEERYLAEAVEHVLAQRYPGELEIVMAIGPSKDLTHEVAERLATEHPEVTVVDNPTGKTPAGLNLAIAAARHDIIVRVDAHGDLTPGYIATAVETMNRTGAANVGGLMDARGRTPFERAVAAAYNSPYGLGSSTFHLARSPEGPADTVFLGTFRRDALRRVGGFDETLFRAQDWDLNRRLREAGETVWFTPAMKVTYRPRSTVKALATQFFATGQWRREVVRRNPETASLRYLVPPATVAGLAAGTVAGVAGLASGRRWLRLGFAAPAAYAAFLAVATARMPKLDPQARLRLPGVLAVMQLTWGAGFLRGLPAGLRRDQGR